MSHFLHTDIQEKSVQYTCTCMFSFIDDTVLYIATILTKANYIYMKTSYYLSMYALLYLKAVN